eukprot:gene5586-5556_t
MSTLFRAISHMHSAKSFNLNSVNVITNKLWQPSVLTKPSKSSANPSKYSVPDKHMDDGIVVIRDGILLSGVMDKNQLGPKSNSVVHCIYELFGDDACGQFLTSVSECLIMYETFAVSSRGVADLMLQPAVAAERVRHLAGVNMSIQNMDKEGKCLETLQQGASDLMGKMFPKHMMRTFPCNNLSAMTLSGAKGSKANSAQMGILLGQQTFGGQRINLNPSGRVLPSFLSADRRGHTRGFAMGRFLSGVMPQDFYIHAIAGRDGLIDTACKTSLSGYLQRCLVKGLEGLVVSGDHSVRQSDGTVVQFTYGGDGADPCRMYYMSNNDFLLSNAFHYRLKYEGISNTFNPARVCKKDGFGLPTILSKSRDFYKSNHEAVAADTGSCVPENVFAKLVALRWLDGQVAPGEPVGLIAAESIG